MVELVSDNLEVGRERSAKQCLGVVRGKVGGMGVAKGHSQQRHNKSYRQQKTLLAGSQAASKVRPTSAQSCQGYQESYREG